MDGEGNRLPALLLQAGYAVRSAQGRNSASFCALVESERVPGCAHISRIQ